MTRTDTHKPSLLDPAEYVFVTAFYQGDSPWIARAYRPEMEEYEQALEEFSVFEGNHAAKGTCDHCGAAFAHGVLFYHTVSTELVHIGHICASNTVGLPDKAAAARKRAEKQAEEMKEREERRERNQGWRDENADLVTWLESLTGEIHSFLQDMKNDLAKWGKLTDRQAAAVEKWRAREIEFQAKKAERERKQAERGEIEPLAEGRYALAGEVLSVKFQDGYYGEQVKMLVELGDGNRVWGTVPRAILPAFDIDALKGRTVKLTATVKRSDKDEHFGYFSRPSGASVTK